MKKYYRLVNPIYEPIGELRNTFETELTPKTKRIIELSPLLSSAMVFWQRTGIQLSTTMDVLLHFDEFLGQIQNLIRENRNIVPSKLFNGHETQEAISLDELSNLMVTCYNIYEEKGIYFSENDLPYVWDYLWDVVRSNMYKEKTSRYMCLFVYDNILQAKALQEQIDPLHDSMIVQVILEKEIKLEQYDAGWLDLLSVDCTFNEFVSSCKNYWEGKESGKPSWENLYEGTYILKEL